MQQHSTMLAAATLLPLALLQFSPAGAAERPNLLFIMVRRCVPPLS